MECIDPVFLITLGNFYAVNVFFFFCFVFAQSYILVLSNFRYFISIYLDFVIRLTLGPKYIYLAHNIEFHQNKYLK